MDRSVPMLCVERTLTISPLPSTQLSSVSADYAALSNNAANLF